VAGSWFSFEGSKELFDRIVQVIFFRDEERTRLRGEAMSAEGRGYQEILRAADAATTVEQNRLEFILKKAEAMRALGMSEEAIALMSQGEMARLERIGQALEVLRRHRERGTIQEAHISELPAGADTEDGP
jgi:thioredoxin-like negative regulator of GroEL